MNCTSKKEKKEKVPQISVMMDLRQKQNNEVTMGRNKLTRESRNRYTHFSWDERLKLQYYSTGTNKHEKITSPTLLGKLFGKHEQTIRRELKRGKIKHDLSEIPFQRWEYNADYAHQDALSYYSAKGPEIKLGKDWKLVAEIARLITEQKYSPYAVIIHFENNGWPSDTRICEKTLYNYIEAGDIVGVSEKDLLYEGKRRKPKKEPKRHSRVANAERSISKRPEEVNDRSEFGHWEIDTVVGGTESSSACVLTLTERKCRTEITRKIADRTAASVTAEIDKLERQIGSVAFRKLFRSITGDNGSEFSNVTGLEQSILTKQLRTQLFFAHPYSSFERGTNENHNGIIRRFIPKGSDIGFCTKKRIREIQNWMNTYPRRILGALSPLEALKRELGPNFHIPDFLEVIL